METLARFSWVMLLAALASPAAFWWFAGALALAHLVVSGLLLGDMERRRKQ